MRRLSLKSTLFGVDPNSLSVSKLGYSAIVEHAQNSEDVFAVPRGFVYYDSHWQKIWHIKKCMGKIGS